MVELTPGISVARFLFCFEHVSSRGHLLGAHLDIFLVSCDIRMSQLQGSSRRAMYLGGGRWYILDLQYINMVFIRSLF